MRRSTQMLLLGLAIFVIGAGVVLVSFTGGDGKGGESTASTTSTTLQAGTVMVNAAPTAAPTSFTIPEGKQALAVQLPFVGGLAGYAKAGDTVNIYGILDANAPGINPPPPVAKLMLPGIQVLTVTGPGPGSDAGNATYLLAVDAAQAEQIIFFSKFQSMWLTLVPKGQPNPQTSGYTYKSAF